MRALSLFLARSDVFFYSFNLNERGSIAYLSAIDRNFTLAGFTAKSLIVWARRVGECALQRNACEAF